MKKEIIQDGTGNYLRIWEVEGNFVGDSIFLHNQPRGFLPVEIQCINGGKEYLYDISGKISLENYLSGNSFSLDEICILFDRLFAMSEEAGEYLLDQNGVVVQEEFLFLDGNIENVAGVYQPEAAMGDVEAYSRLLEFIMEKMNQKDQKLVFFVYNMHKLSKQPECTRELLKTFTEEAVHAERGNPAHQKKFSGEMMIPGEQEREKPVIAAVEDMVKKKPGKELIWAGALLALALAGFSFLWFYGVFETPVTGQTDWLKAGGAALFFFVVAGYGIWRLLSPHGMRRLSEAEVCWETGGERKRVCLIPSRGGEPVPLDYFPCHVGTAEEKVDAVIRAEGISGVHAQFLCEGGNILVVDEESAGGTYANEQRLVPWQKKIVRDGDLLRLATKEFVVEITQSEYVI